MYMKKFVDGGPALSGGMLGGGGGFNAPAMPGATASPPTTGYGDGGGWDSLIPMPRVDPPFAPPVASPQVTQFQPTFSPAQRGIGSLQPYQAPNVPAMESSPTDYNQSPQYAPTQQYGASATSYSAPAANPMTASWDSYSEGPKYKPDAADTFIPLPYVAPPVAPPGTPRTRLVPQSEDEPDRKEYLQPDGSYSDLNPALIGVNTRLVPQGEDEPNRTEYQLPDESWSSLHPALIGLDTRRVSQGEDGSDITEYQSPDGNWSSAENFDYGSQNSKPPVTQTYGETTPSPTPYNPATPSYLDNPAFTAPVAKDSGSDSGYFYDEENNRRSVYDEYGNRRYNDDGSNLYGGGDGGDKAGGLIRAYARGGSTPQGIASLGRGEDTQLVHMTPGEVRGLQQLALAHGGSLTINPHTGLVEAGFLSSMLPMLIGAGLMMIPGMQPLGAAAITGAGYGVATGDLKKGLMAGLGAYGGAGLGGSLGGMGAEALATTPEAYATALGVEGAATGAKSQAAMLAEGAKDFGLEGLQRTAEAAMPNNPVQFPKYADMDMAQRAGAMQKGLGSVNPFSDTFNKTAATSFLDKNKYQLAGAFAGPVMEAMKPQSMTPMNPEPDQYDRELARYHLAPNYQAYVPPRPNPYYRAVYAAEGGDVSRMAVGGTPRTKTLSRKPDIPDVGIIPLDDITTARLSPDEAALIRMQTAARRANLMPYTPPKTAIKGLGDIGPPTSMLANGGIAELPSEYAAGGKLLQGPGDGMSDSIPAVIKGPRPQRAALAQGEFVVPADVVSHLGNGSTDAGAKRLYAMMNNIRKARTGTKKQGKQINAAHFMPA